MSSPIKLDNTLGAIFLGNIVASIFYGITSVQTFSYYKHNGNDSRYMKMMIFSLWILDGLHLALITDTVYTYAVINFTDLLAFTVPTRSIVVHVAVQSTSDFIVRSFFCHRVWRLSKRSWILGIAIGGLTLLVFGTILAITIEFFKMSHYSQLKNIAWLLYLTISGILAVDFIIAVSLCWLLSKHRTGFKRTNSIIRVLMLYSINTCVLTTVAGFCCFITFITMPDNLIFMAFYFAMPKLFLNSLLATLNSRKYLREMGSGAPVMSTPLSALSGTRTSASADGVGGKSRPQYEDQVLQIQIQTTTDIKSDSTTPIV